MSGVFAKNLRRILAAEDITQKMLSEWSGVPRRTIESWIAGREPGAEKLMRVAHVLRRPMDDFFKEEGMRDMRKKMDGCCYCDDDRIIDQGAVWLGKVGTIACINSNNELVVNIDGAQANIPILGCPWCCKKLDSNAEVCSE